MGSYSSEEVKALTIYKSENEESENRIDEQNQDKIEKQPATYSAGEEIEIFKSSTTESADKAIVSIPFKDSPLVSRKTSQRIDDNDSSRKSYDQLYQENQIFKSMILKLRNKADRTIKLLTKELEAKQERMCQLQLEHKGFEEVAETDKRLSEEVCQNASADQIDIPKRNEIDIKALIKESKVPNRDADSDEIGATIVTEDINLQIFKGKATTSNLQPLNDLQSTSKEEVRRSAPKEDKTLKESFEIIVQSKTSNVKDNKTLLRQKDEDINKQTSTTSTEKDDDYSNTPNISPVSLARLVDKNKRSIDRKGTPFPKIAMPKRKAPSPPSCNPKVSNISKVVRGSNQSEIHFSESISANFERKDNDDQVIHPPCYYNNCHSTTKKDSHKFAQGTDAHGEINLTEDDNNRFEYISKQSQYFLNIPEAQIENERKIEENITMNHKLAENLSFNPGIRKKGVGSLREVEEFQDTFEEEKKLTNNNGNNSQPIAFSTESDVNPFHQERSVLDTVCPPRPPSSNPTARAYIGSFLQTSNLRSFEEHLQTEDEDATISSADIVNKEEVNGLVENKDESSTASSLKSEKKNISTACTSNSKVHSLLDSIDEKILEKVDFLHCPLPRLHLKEQKFETFQNDNNNNHSKHQCSFNSTSPPLNYTPFARSYASSSLEANSNSYLSESNIYHEQNPSEQNKDIQRLDNGKDRASTNHAEPNSHISSIQMVNENMKYDIKRSKEKYPAAKISHANSRSNQANRTNNVNQKHSNILAGNSHPSLSLGNNTSITFTSPAIGSFVRERVWNRCKKPVRSRSHHTNSNESSDFMESSSNGIKKDSSQQEKEVLQQKHRKSIRSIEEINKRKSFIGENTLTFSSVPKELLQSLPISVENDQRNGYSNSDGLITAHELNEDIFNILSKTQELDHQINIEKALLQSNSNHESNDTPFSDIYSSDISQKNAQRDVVSDRSAQRENELPKYNAYFEAKNQIEKIRHSQRSRQNSFE